MSSSSSSTVLLAGSALLVAAATVAAFYPKASPESTSTEITEIDETNTGGDYITEDDVCKVFDRLFMEMQGVLAQLSQQIQQMQAMGQMIPEQQLRIVLKQEFERALVTKQKIVFDEVDCDEDCLQEATWAFLEEEEQYPKVKICVERFQRLWENISGESVVGKRPGKVNDKSIEEDENIEILEPTRLLEVAEIYFSALTKAMGNLITEFKNQGKDLNSPSVAQELQMSFASIANDAGENALQDLNITLKQFQSSIEAHSSNPQIGRALGMMQMKQQQELMSMGLPTR